MKLKIVSSNDDYKNTPKGRVQTKDQIDPGILTITKISQQIKQKDRYSIYVNEKYKFSLNEYQLASSGLRLGKTFNSQELNALIGESQFGKAYERALNYVMIRPRSQKEIKAYLDRTFLYPKPKIYTDRNGRRNMIKQEVDKTQITAMIDRVIERLTLKGYINDTSFAKAWVNSRQLTKKSSKRKMEQELRTKGVAANIISNILDSESIDERENLKLLIQKKKRLNKYKDDKKLMQYLMRQGYNYEMVKEAMSGDI